MGIQEDLSGARAATATLLAHLDGIDLTKPSLLPGWSRAHVVAHLAGNARSHVRMLDGCLSGDVVAQYPGGSAGRTAEIEGLAVDPAGALAAHRQACLELDARWVRMIPEHWERDVERLDAGVRSATGLAWSRWKEVEVHRVDLAADYGPADWDLSFARRLLSTLLARPDLPPMTVVARGEEPVGRNGPQVTGSAQSLAGWLSGRSDGADLDVANGGLPPVPPWD